MNKITTVAVTIFVILIIINIPISVKNIQAQSTFKYPNPANYGNTIYVDDDNIEGPWDGTLEHPFQYLHNAIDVADEGDTVFVFSGVYFGLRLNKSISIIGEDKNTTTIRYTSGGIYAFYILADYVNLSGFTLWDYWEARTMLLIASNYCNISNIIFKNLFLPGNSPAIQLSNASHNVISKNIMGYALDNVGIALYKSNDNIIRENSVGQCNIGLRLTESCNNTIVFNDFTAFMIGVRLGNCSSGNYIVSNDICGNRCFGVFDSSDNDIIFNNFIGGSITFSNCNNYWDGNFWRRSRLLPKPIFGLMGTGLVCFPWFNFDWHPAQKPYEI